MYCNANKLHKLRISNVLSIRQLFLLKAIYFIYSQTRNVNTDAHFHSTRFQTNNKVIPLLKLRT